MYFSEWRKLQEERKEKEQFEKPTLLYKKQKKKNINTDMPDHYPMELV